MPTTPSEPLGKKPIVYPPTPADAIIERANAWFHAGDLDPTADMCVCGHPHDQHRGVSGNNGNLVDEDGNVVLTEDGEKVCRKFRADPAYALALEVASWDGYTLAELLEAGQQAERKQTGAHSAPEGGVAIGASDVSSCPRWIWYRERPPADFVPRIVDKTPANIGTAIHEAAEKARRLVMPWVKVDVPVSLPGLDRLSHADEYDPVRAVLSDDKTGSEYVMDLLDRYNDGKPEHWDQAMVYALALRRAGFDVRFLELKYLARGAKDETGVRNFLRPYDEVQAMNALEYLVGMAADIEDGVVLPRAADRTGPEHPLCKSCPALEHCWNTTVAEAEGRNPVSLTLMGRHPEEAAIADVAAVRIVASSYDRATKDGKTLVGNMLEDVPDGEYTGRFGTFRVAAQERTAVVWKDYAENLREAYEQPEDKRPLLHEIPRPMSTSRFKRVYRVKDQGVKRVMDMPALPGEIALPDEVTMDDIVALPGPADIVGQITAMPFRQSEPEPTSPDDEIVDGEIEEEKSA